MIIFETINGRIEISQEYLSKLIGHAVTSCYGVVGMAPSTNKQKLFKLISKDNSLDTGIKVTGDSDLIDVELHIIVTYGMNINAIAASITEKVKYVVKTNTGIDVDKVVVRVDDIKE